MNLDVIKNNIDYLKSKISMFEYFIFNHKNIIILGNGGSNAIASHIAQDYTKTLNKNAFSFSDSSKLTCYINDYGHDLAFVEFIKDYTFLDNLLVILISSSGNSENIVNCARFCEKNDIVFITLSGFDYTNKLNSFSKSALNIHVDSKNYGEVECLHEIFLHSVC
jgi:D-sedoheptulose 7-phosphate isomerase